MSNAPVMHASPASSLTLHTPPSYTPSPQLTFSLPFHHTHFPRTSHILTLTLALSIPTQHIPPHSLLNTCPHTLTASHSHSHTPSHTLSHTISHTHTSPHTPTLPTHPGGQPLVDVLSGVGGWDAANISQGGPWNYSQLTVDQMAGSQAFFSFSVGADPVNSSRQAIFVSALSWYRCGGWVGALVVCMCVCMCAFYSMTSSVPLCRFIKQVSFVGLLLLICTPLAPSLPLTTSSIIPHVLTHHYLTPHLLTALPFMSSLSLPYSLYVIPYFLTA